MGSEPWVCIAPLLSREGPTFAYTDDDAQPGVSYEYEVEVLGPSGPAGRWGPVSAELPLMPLWLGLSPNPGRQTLTVAFGLTQTGSATILLFDAAGREVARKVMPGLRAGNHRVVWKPEAGRRGPLHSGAYWIRLDTHSGTRTASWTVLR